MWQEDDIVVSVGIALVEELDGGESIVAEVHGFNGSSSGKRAAEKRRQTPRVAKGK